MRSRCTDFILFLLFSSTHALLFDNEVEASASPIGKMPHAVRHVEFIGTTDNGTLDCTFPGFTHYRWELINKVSAGPYAESSTLILDGKIKRHQSKIKIGKGGLPMATEMLVVSCELMKDDRPKFQIIWVVTRLPSPLGYPTDPRLCNYKEHRYYWSSCDRYFWEFHTDCYHGNGADYKGYAYITKGNPPLLCHYWFLDRDGKNYDVGYGNEHRYCRNPTNDHSPWCFTADGPSTRRKEFCRVRECSDCMYGYGNGTFPQYRYLIEDLERDFPVYNGRTILTIKKGSGGKPRRCLTGNRWKWNLCRHRENKLTPHCYIAKEEKDEPHVHDIHDPRVELVKCRIPQCTVRQVWFLFLSSFDNPYLKESNLEHVEILLIHGQSMRLDFMAFGIHLTSGLSVSSDDPRLAKYAQNFKMEARAPPDGRSRIIIHNLHHEMSGNYFVQYVFEEADPRIQQNMYRGNFKLDVRIPMSLSIKPDKLKLCRGHSGSLSAHVSGGFPLFQGSLKWKHGYYERGRATLHEVSVDDPVFKLSADFKRLTAKEITKHTWIVVEGIAHSGITSALALFQLKPQPHLVPKSATRIFALPGDGISMTVEMEKGLRTTWTYDAQFIPEVPEDPELAFERSLKKDIITESLVISSLDWRHYGTYVVETKKDGCRETVLFTIEHDKERMMMEEANLTSSGEGVDENLPAITKSGECDVKVLKLGTYDEQNYAKNWTIEVPCYRKEENEGTVAYDHDVEELSPCSVITGYMFTTRTQREYRLLISGDERKKMVEYEGDVHMKKNYTVNNDDEAWTYEYFFAEPVPARYVRFVADQVDDSKCLFGLTLTGCTLAKSICRPETFTANDVLCGDRQSSLLNKEEVRQLPTCSLITGYEFTSNKSSAHTLMISGQNSMVLREYDGDIEIEIEYFQRHWLFHHTLAEHALARYVQFVPLDQDGGSLTMDNLQVTGCRLDQHWCNLDWATFRNLGIKCEEDQIFPIYNEHPVFELPSCSMITHYQFVGKRFKQHFFMISGYNPKLRRNFQEGLRIESFYYKDDEWVFVCSFDTLIAARFLQFVCDSRGNDTCLEKLTVSGCAVEESWCNDKLETRTVEHYRRRNFFHGALGKSLLLTTIASFVIPILMFIVGKYSLDKRLINVLMRMAEKFRKKPEPAMTSNKAD